MQKIVPCLWYDGAAEEAAAFYASLIPGSAVGKTTRYGKAGHEVHGQDEGSVLTVELLLAGTEVVALNGGPRFRFTPAISLFVTLPDRADVDRAWDGLIEGGRSLMPIDAYPWAPRYGWLADRWGLTWQVALGDPAASGRRLVPSLMFTRAEAGRAEEAMNLWAGLLPDSGIDGVLRWNGAESPDRAGTVKHARFRLAGKAFMAMDSALTPDFGFNEAFSLMILCEDQAEIDRLWAAMSAVPEAEACGWLKDRFGVSWQVAPRETNRMLSGPDRAAADRVLAAVMEMKKIDIARLEAAFAA